MRVPQPVQDRNALGKRGGLQAAWIKSILNDMKFALPKDCKKTGNLIVCLALAVASGCGHSTDSDSSKSTASPGNSPAKSNSPSPATHPSGGDAFFTTQRARKIEQAREASADTNALANTVAASHESFASNAPAIPATKVDQAARVERFQRLREKAAAGDMDAKYLLARAFAAGDGVGKDEIMAQQFFLEAAKAGNPQAQQSLYRRYLSGEGTAANPQEAINWLATAAEAGYAPSQVLLGTAYLTRETNYTEAARWYQKAADAGNLDGQLQLGNLLKDAPADMQNDVESYKWLYIASLRNEPSAAASLQALAQRMSPENIAQARQMALPLVPPVNPILRKDPNSDDQ